WSDRPGGPIFEQTAGGSLEPPSRPRVRQRESLAYGRPQVPPGVHPAPHIVSGGGRRFGRVAHTQKTRPFPIPDTVRAPPLLPAPPPRRHGASVSSIRRDTSGRPSCRKLRPTVGSAVRESVHHIPAIPGRVPLDWSGGRFWREPGCGSVIDQHTA